MYATKAAVKAKASRRLRLVDIFCYAKYMLTFNEAYAIMKLQIN